MKLFLNKDGYGFNDIVTWLVTDRDYVPTKLTGYIYGKSLFTGRIGTKDDTVEGILVEMGYIDYENITQYVVDPQFMPDGAVVSNAITGTYKGETYYDIGHMARVVGCEETTPLTDFIDIYLRLPVRVNYSGREHVVRTWLDIMSLFKALNLDSTEFYRAWTLFHSWPFIIALYSAPPKAIRETDFNELVDLLSSGYLPCKTGWVTLTDKGLRVVQDNVNAERIPFERYAHLREFYPFKNELKNGISVEDWIGHDVKIKPTPVRRVEPVIPFDFILGHDLPEVRHIDGDCIIEMDLSFPSSYTKEEIRDLAQKNLKGIWSYFLKVLSSYKSTREYVKYLKPTRMTALNTKHLHIMAELKEGLIPKGESGGETK